MAATTPPAPRPVEWPGKLLPNRIAHTRALPPHKLSRWIKHHIEEVGKLENFPPDLFESRAESEP